MRCLFGREIHVIRAAGGLLDCAHIDQAIGPEVIEVAANRRRGDRKLGRKVFDAGFSPFDDKFENAFTCGLHSNSVPRT